MCLIGFVWDSHPKYKLIFVSNRDEFYNRSSAPIHFWKESPDLIAGKDLEGGGTWLGTTRKGRFAAITNYRDPKNIKQNAPTRGMLTYNFLAGLDSPEEYLSQISTKAKDYNGFNLLVGDLLKGELYFFSNYENKIKKVEKGIYGLSNALLNTPWHKVNKVKEKLTKITTENPERIESTLLLKTLIDKEMPEDSQVQQTGLPMRLEKMLSPMFIESEDYGTRASSVILLDRRNSLLFKERVYKGENYRQEVFQFQIESYLG